MLEDAIDGHLIALDDVEDAVGDAGLVQHWARRWRPGSFSDGEDELPPQAMALANITSAPWPG